MTADLRLIFPFDISSNYVMNTLHSDGTTRHEKHPFGSKDFALEPCNKKSFHQRLHNQMHHTVLNPNAKCTKRKLDQYMNDHKFVTALGLITREKCGNQNAILSEKIEHCSICRQYYPHLGDPDAFIEGPNSMKQGNLKNHCKDLVTTSSYTNSTETSIKEKPTKKLWKAMKSLVNEDFDNSSETSHSLKSKNEGMELNQPQNNLSSKDNHIPRPVIPIGPNFQAEVPKWEGTTYVTHQNIDDDLKWFGIQIWPRSDSSKNNTKGIGEGRPDSCCCEFPGSLDCVKLHISEARELLKLEIGTTFSSWKFDEMGEEVSESWTLEEQKEFESLVKLNLLSNGKNFWKLVMDHFPSKFMKCMVNYYHNVYIPRRLSMETRSSYDVVDSDNDQDEIRNNKNDYSSTGIIIVHVTNLFLDDQFYV
ncbi:AT-rich interactive domain-containing protein 2 [Spatholobus suberectus]|nr:AT-rich interactive domain-containing protein 2 [Spatholobus suberectus]